MAFELVGPLQITPSRDAEGHRDYRVAYRIRGEITDDPALLYATPGLPQPGDDYGPDDPWAWCRADAHGTQVVAKEPNQFWDLEILFSSRPAPPDKQRNQDTPIEDPLLEPPKVSGTFVKYTEEASHDRFGVPITNSAYEPIHGPKNEWDANRATVKIIQNVATFFQAVTLPGMMVDHVNDGEMWGLGPRCVKLSDATWDRKYYGHGNVYYERSCMFDLNGKTFDRDIGDEGTKVLNGHWDKTTGGYVLDRIGSSGVMPSEFNPQHFMRFKDRNGENTRVVLNGHGLPAGVRLVRRFPIRQSFIGGGGGEYWEQEGSDDIVSASGTPVICTTDVVHGLSTGATIVVDGMVGFEQANGQWVVTVIDAYKFSLNGSSGFGSGLNFYAGGGGWHKYGLVASTTSGTPITVTSANHGLSTGEQVQVFSLANAPANGIWFVTVVNSNVFSLDGSIGDGSSTVPSGTGTSGEDTSPGQIHVEKYDEANLLALGIPLVF